MKTGPSWSLRLFCVLWLLSLAVLPQASAQTPPTLVLTWTGQSTLNITGDFGTVYSIQYATNLSSTDQWIDRALVQVQGTDASWTDPSSPAPGQRFYRVVTAPLPADPNLVFIQPGTFVMGSPTNELARGTDETQHTVTISRGFWIGKYLVTQGEYFSVTGNNPGFFTSAHGYIDDPTRPVESVSWYDAANYCALRTGQERFAGLIPPSYAYRLPTESEWEYAARAGTTTAFYLGTGLYSGQANFDGHYQYDSNVGQIYKDNGIYLVQTATVGSYTANAWGLYDVIGNLNEWCQDWYDTYPTGPAVDPQGPVTGTYRVVRGGGWS